MSVLHNQVDDVTQRPCILIREDFLRLCKRIRQKEMSGARFELARLSPSDV